MAVTIVVRSRVGGGGRELSLTLDAPRVVIGRGDGCEVRLPDPSVSHRHASIRQRGGEYVVVDEGSVNGTFLGEVRLPPQTPRAVKSGELMRVGRVWLEIRIEPALVKGSTAMAAKELALALVERGLAAQGEDPSPRVTVTSGPDKDRALILADPLRAYTVGRGKDTSLTLEDAVVARHHVSITRRGDALLVTDTSTEGAQIDGARVGRDTVWRAGQVLTLGKSALRFDYPAAEALLELEQSPDERMQPGEADGPPAAEETPSSAAAAPSEEETATPAPPSSAAWDPPSSALAPEKKRKPEGSWGVADAAVVLIAIGVIVVSGLGALWLFSH